jgi:putative transposase
LIDQLTVPRWIRAKSAVSEITDRLWADYQAVIARDLSDIEVEYLFADAVFESLRRHGANEALLVCWGIRSDGRKHLLHLAVGNKESERCWTGFSVTCSSAECGPRPRSPPTARQD